MKALLHSLLEAATLGRPVVLCTVVHSGGSAPRSAGAHMAVFADGSTRGTVGGGRLELLAAKEGLSLLQRQTSALRAYDLSEREGGIGMASEFAANLAQKKQSWHEADWVKYKALLSVAGCPSLQDAIQLMHGLDDYDLRPDVAATWDYAEVVLREKYPDLPEELFQTPQAAMVGRQMLEENHAAITDYGLFRRKDNGQLPVFQREPQAMDSPQMGGM